MLVGVRGNTRSRLTTAWLCTAAVVVVPSSPQFIATSRMPRMNTNSELAVSRSKSGLVSAASASCTAAPNGG